MHNKPKLRFVIDPKLGLDELDPVVCAMLEEGVELL